MRSATVIIFAFIAQVHAEQDFSDKLVDKLTKKLMTKLVDTLLDSPVDLDSATMGKPAAGVMNTRVAALPAAIPRGFTMGCPVRPRGSPVARAEVKLGSDSGGLVFVPDSITIKSGESVKFVNNAGFPHNIIFDEDSVPEGVNSEALSREDYLNAPGESYSVKFDKAGTYGYYCQPHQGAGMKGTITVN